MKKLLLITLVTSISLLNACSAERISHFPSYKLTVPQGNELDERAVSSLSAGMSKAQVRSILGTPLLQDPFHQNRWDYPYVVSKNGVVKKNSTLILYFEGDVLVRFETIDATTQE